MQRKAVFGLLGVFCFALGWRHFAPRHENQSFAAPPLDERGGEDSKPPPPRMPVEFTFSVNSGTVAKTKKDGRAWDFGPSRIVPPDPYVKVQVYDTEGGLADTGSTNAAQDTYTPVWNQKMATVKEGWTVKLEAWDKDGKYDDEIGKHEFKITREKLKKGEVVLSFGQMESLKIEFWPAALEQPRILLQQPYPGPRSGEQLQRSKDQHLAVILLQGLDVRHDGSSPREPRPQSWQGSTSPLVKALSKHADVFALSYAQTAPVEETAALAELRETAGKIKRLGYTQVVLMGYSAGGLLARHFVEDCPNAGVTRVIQVATPNAGAHFAEWGVLLGQVPRQQDPFVKSLAPSHRAGLLESRKDRTIPPATEFVTVMTMIASGEKGDSAVSRQSQWPADLQKQGIPCVPLQASHREVMTHDDAVRVLCTLATQPQKRWSQDKVREKAQEWGLSPR